MGFTCALPVTVQAVVSYTAFPPSPQIIRQSRIHGDAKNRTSFSAAVYFCCTFLGVASTGRYPASCPVKPGLSSPAAFRQLQPRSFVLLILFSKKQPLSRAIRNVPSRPITHLGRPLFLPLRSAVPFVMCLPAHYSCRASAFSSSTLSRAIRNVPSGPLLMSGVRFFFLYAQPCHS